MTKKDPIMEILLVNLYERLRRRAVRTGKPIITGWQQKPGSYHLNQSETTPVKPLTFRNLGRTTRL